eukprot:14005217-Heterocapsa_arctica.AAC.1
MVHWAAYTGELHKQGYGGQMETGPEWRAVPMGQQDRQVHKAGVHGQQDELSSGYETMTWNFINDDRSSVSLEVRQSTAIWRSKRSYDNLKYETAQRQHQLEHFSSLEHSQ